MTTALLSLSSTRRRRYSLFLTTSTFLSLIVSKKVGWEPYVAGLSSCDTVGWELYVAGLSSCDTDLLQDKVQFVMLGTGEKQYEDWMRVTEAALKDKFCGLVGLVQHNLDHSIVSWEVIS